MGRNVWIAIAALALAGSGTAWVLVGAPLRAKAEIAAGYAAKYVCGCVFVSAISEDRCRADLGPEMASLKTDVDRVAETVEVRAPILASALARHEAPFGCKLD